MAHDKNEVTQLIHSRLDRWQVAVLIFVVVYAIFLTINMNNITMQWDEVNHFNGALLLIRGQILQYVAINSYYPPVFNLVTAAYFALGGASVLAGRLVALTFSVLSMYVVYQIGKETYSKKIGLVSAILFAVMPGIVLLSSTAMIETMLIFVFSTSMLFFFRWLRTSLKRDVIVSVVAFMVGIAVKYQTLVLAPIIVIFGLLVLGKGDVLKAQISGFVHSRRLWLGVGLAAVAAVLLYAFYASGLLSVWLYVMQIGNSGQVWYSNRFPTPIFYLIEMVWPYHDRHPISLLLYGLALAGLALLVYRRKPQDKFLFIWFLATLIVFTFIPNRQWRYVTLLFPVLAISAAELVTLAYSKAERSWKSAENYLTKKRIAKFAAALLILFTAIGVFYSCMDAYVWVAGDQSHVPIEQATEYIAPRVIAHQSVIVLCPYNLFNKDMVWFYLNSKSPSQTQVYQYPELPVDAYTPEFDVTAFMNFCETNNTRYVMLYEYGGTIPYFNSNLTEQAVYGMLNGTRRFTQEATFGTEPERIFLMSFK